MATDEVNRVVQIHVKGSAETIRALKQQAEAFERMEKRIESTQNVVKNFFLGFTAYVSAGAILNFFSSLTNEMDELADKSVKLGISAEGLQEWTYAAQMSGASVESLEAGIKKLSVGLADMGDSTAESTQALKKFGVDAKGTTEEALLKIAEGFAKMDDGFNKTALAMKLFGKQAGPELLPLLSQGAAGIEELIKKAREMGYVIDNETIAAVNDLKDKVDDIYKSLAAAGKQILSGMVPALTALADEFLKADTAAGNFKTMGEEIGDMLINVSGWMVQARVNAQNWFTLMFTMNDVLSPMFKGDRMAVLKSEIEGMKAADKAAKDTIESLNRRYDQQVNKRGNQDWAKAMGLLPPDLKGAGGGGGGGGKKPPKTEAEKAADELKKFADQQRSAALEVKKLTNEQQLNYLVMEKGLDLSDKKIKAAYDEALYIAKLADLRDRNVRAEKEETEAGLENVKVLEAQRREYEKLIDKYTKVGDPLAEYKQALEEIDKLIADSRTTDEQRQILERAAGQLEKKYFGEIKSEAKDTMMTLADLGKMLQSEIEGFAKNTASSIVDFCFGAKQSFGDMVESMLKDLAKLSLKRAIDPFFNAVGTGAGEWVKQFMASRAQGGVFNPGGAVAFATGGIVSGPTAFAYGGGSLGVMGEAGPEAVAPLKRDKSGNLGVSASPVTVNVINNNASQIKVEETQSSNGGKQLQIMVDSAVEQSIGKGRFDRVLSTSYGVTRRGK